MYRPFFLILIFVVFIFPSMMAFEITQVNSTNLPDFDHINLLQNGNFSTLLLDFTDETILLTIKTYTSEFDEITSYTESIVNDFGFDENSDFSIKTEENSFFIHILNNTNSTWITIDENNNIKSYSAETCDDYIYVNTEKMMFIRDFGIFEVNLIQNNETLTYSLYPGSINSLIKLHNYFFLISDIESDLSESIFLFDFDSNCLDTLTIAGLGGWFPTARISSENSMILQGCSYGITWTTYHIDVNDGNINLNYSFSNDQIYYYTFNHVINSNKFLGKYSCDTGALNLVKYEADFGITSSNTNLANVSVYFNFSENKLLLIENNHPEIVCNLVDVNNLNNYETEIINDTALSNSLIYILSNQNLFVIDSENFTATEYMILPTSNDDNVVPSKKLFTSSYPNPFKPENSTRNPGLKIEYNLPKDSLVDIAIYNILGQKIKTLMNKNQKSGLNEVIWNGQNENNKKVSSGVYFYKIQTKYDSIVDKILLVR